MENLLHNRVAAMTAFVLSVFLWSSLLAGLVQVGNAAASTQSESLSCTVTGGTCQVVTSQNIETLNSVTQTVPISADKTGDSTVGGDNRTITITSISAS